MQFDAKRLGHELATRFDPSPRRRVTSRELAAKGGIGKRDAAPETRIPVLASTHAFQADLQREVERHVQYVQRGYLGVKIGLGKRGEARLGYDVDQFGSKTSKMHDIILTAQSVVMTGDHRPGQLHPRG